MLNLLAAIQFDPNIRGVLVVLVGVLVLVGTPYLLLATNVGVRNGFLIAMAALFGWMFAMGGVWWIYGIGLKGKDPSWVAQEINYSRSSEAVHDQLNKLPKSESLPDPEQFLADYLDAHPDVAKEIQKTEGEDFKAETLTKAVTAAPALKTKLDTKLNGWRILPESDSRRGDASAAADAAILAEQVFGSETSSADYTIKDVFLYGGKSAAEPETVKGERGLLDKAWRRIETTFELKNPPLYAAVTLQKNIVQVTAPGEAPPPAEVDPKASTITILLERNLGNKREVPALFCIFNGIIFFVLIWMLNRRDKRSMQVHAEWDPSTATPAVPEKVG
jgi:hypothetical protein